MINGRIIMSGEFGRLWEKWFWPMLRYYSAIWHSHGRMKNTWVPGHCGNPVSNSSEWCNRAVSQVEVLGSHRSTAQNMYIIGLRCKHTNKSDLCPSY
jgi:hypothetical protein